MKRLTNEDAHPKDSVESFAEQLDGWQRVSYAQLLSLIRATFPFGEHIKWGNPYFEIAGSAVMKTFCAKDWINVYFFRGCELADPDELFEATTNARMRTIRITSRTVLDPAPFRDLLARAVELSREH